HRRGDLQACAVPEVGEQLDDLLRECGGAEAARVLNGDGGGDDGAGPGPLCDRERRVPGVDAVGDRPGDGRIAGEVADVDEHLCRGWGRWAAAVAFVHDGDGSGPVN